jgi:hypothetical protein
METKSECQHPGCRQLRRLQPVVNEMLPLLAECISKVDAIEDLNDRESCIHWFLPDNTAYEHGHIYGALQNIVRAIENPLQVYMGCDECQRKSR